MANAEPTSPPAGDTAYLYRAAIGPRGQDYYLRHFARFDSDGRVGASWNWAAYWSTFNWMVYRKMWGWLMAYVGALLGLLLLIFGVGKLLVGYSDSSAALLSLAMLTAAFVVPGLYGNAWFYAHCNDRITLALRATQDLKQAATLLAGQAPGGRRMVFLMAANAIFAGLVALVYLNLPAGDATAPPLAARSGKVADLIASASTPPSKPSADPAAQAPRAVSSAPGTTGPSEGVVAAATVPASATASEAHRVLATDRASASEARARSGRLESATGSGGEIATPVSSTGSPSENGIANKSGALEAASATTLAAAEPAATASRPAPRRHYVWVIQVGAFAQGENADHALAVVQSLGFDAGEEKFRTRGGDQLTRVRVGPFSQQGEAEAAALRIRSLDLPALLIRQRP